MNITTSFDQAATVLTRNRYQRISPWYDRMEALSEKRYLPWRRKLWSQVTGQRIIEVGVGTGKNMPFYPAGIQISAVDLTPGMLERARKRALDLKLHVDLRLGDAQNLEFPKASFDAAVATFVFCSVPDPVQGFREIKRVVRPGGYLYLLEHMRSNNPFLGKIMDMVNPMVVRMIGANINRRTVENIQKAGLKVEEIEDLGTGGIFKLIVAHV